MTPRRVKDIAALLLVLAAAAFVRLYRLDAVEFFHDEAMVSMMAQEMADGQTFPLQGILSSVGIPNPPSSIYVMAVPFALTSDPVVATGFVALLNVLGVGLLWGIARKEFGFIAALVAGLVFAFNPWAILYSRKIWAQDYVNPFLLLALTAALWGYRDGKRWGQLLALPLMLFAMQIHFAAWALVPLFTWIAWTGRRVIHRWTLPVSLVLGALIILPYALALAQTLQSDPTRISDMLSRSGVTQKGSLDALADAFNLAAGVNIESWVAPAVESSVFGPPSSLASLASLPLLALMLVGVVAFARRSRIWFVGFALWIALPIAAFQIGLADIWPHYFVPQLPAFALLAGSGAAALTAWPVSLRRPLAIVAGSGIAAALIVQFAYYSAVMNYGYSHNIALGAGTSGYTTPSSILNQVRDAIPPTINNVIVLSDGDRVWFDVEAARWPVILRDRAACVRTLPSSGFTVIPDGPYAVLRTPTTSAAMNDAYPDGGAVVIPARLGERSYSVTLIEPTQMLQTSIAQFSNGVALIAWSVVGDSLTLTFRLPEAPSRTFYGALDFDYQYFVHLLDAGGSRIGQSDASFWPGRHWCANDQLTLSLIIAGSSDAAVLRFGFYKLLDAELPSTQAIDILDAAGNPAGNWVDLPIGADQGGD